MAIKVYEFIGQRTGKVYAKGYKRDCLRMLHKEYPFDYGKNKTGVPSAKPLFPEPIIFKEVR